MLLRFTFENHASYPDRTELTFLGSALRAAPDRRLAVEGAPHGAVRLLALYGGNATGKSRALDALVQMRQHVLFSHRRLSPTEHIPRNPFRLDPGSRAQATRFECEFVLDGVRHAYGFCFTDRAFVEEWLHVWPGHRRQTWFHRDSDFQFPSLPGPKATIARLTRPNSLFLSAAAQNNQPELGRIHRFFEEQILVGPGLDGLPPGAQVLDTGGLLTDAGHRDRIVRLLRAADLGIANLKLESREQLVRRALQPESAEGGTRALAQVLEEGRGPGEVLLEHTGAAGHSEWFEQDLESRGTVTLLQHLGSMLRALANGALLLVDELDASLHPRLSAELLRLFLDPVANPRGAQLLFTTHDEAVLDVLHRDEVVFVEKSGWGVSRLTPLTDFKTLARDDIRRAYNLGRFGGVPNPRVLARALADSETGEHG